MGRTQGEMKERIPATKAVNKETEEPIDSNLVVYTASGPGRFVNDCKGLPPPGYCSRSSIRLSQALRPTLARSYQRPSMRTRTTSAVKSLFVPQTSHEERSHEPTPYKSAGTPSSSNCRMRAGVNPPVTAIFTSRQYCSAMLRSSAASPQLVHSRSIASRMAKTSRGFTPQSSRLSPMGGTETSRMLDEVSGRTPKSLYLSASSRRPALSSCRYLP